MAANKKTIVVVGATGKQGSSVVKTFAQLPNWHVKALTRTPSSPTARDLASKGAELVTGDLTDPQSLETAFSGAHAIFLNTDFWEVYRPLKAANDAKGIEPAAATLSAYQAETTKGRNAVDAAAKVSTLERLVYSTLAPAAKASGGRYSGSGHNNTKAWITEYIEGHPVVAGKASFVYIGGYASNVLLHPRPDPRTGALMYYNMFKREAKFPIIDPTRSTGPFVRALVEDEAPGTRLLAYDSSLNVGEIAAVWKSVSGKDVTVIDLTTTDAKEKMDLGAEMLDVLDAANEFGYMGGVGKYIEPKDLKNKVHTKPWEEWLKENVSV